MKPGAAAIARNSSLASPLRGLGYSLSAALVVTAISSYEQKTATSLNTLQHVLLIFSEITP